MWVNPTPGRHTITARFGEQGSNWANGHTGLDFAAPAGSDVVAVDRGIVTFAGWGGPAYGNIIRMRHAGVDSWYAHLATINTHVLAQPAQGAKIGTVGETGNATGPHVHLEARVAGKAVNPERYLSGGGGASTGEVAGAGITGALADMVPGLAPILAFANGIQDVIGFVTNPENWKRVALFTGGGVLVILALYLVFQKQAGSLVKRITA